MGLMTREPISLDAVPMLATHSTAETWPGSVGAGPLVLVAATVGEGNCIAGVGSWYRRGWLGCA